MQREILLILKNKKLESHLKRIKKSKSPICLFQLQKKWFKYNKAFSVIFNINKKSDVFLIPNLVKTLKEIVLQKTLESRTGSACSQCVFVTKNLKKLRLQCWSVPIQFKKGKGIQCLFSVLKNKQTNKQTNLDPVTTPISQIEKTTSTTGGEFYLSTEDSQSTPDFENSVLDELIDKKVDFAKVDNKENNFQTNNLSEGKQKKNQPKYLNFEMAVQVLSQNKPKNSDNEIMKETNSDNSPNKNGSENNSKIYSDLKQLSPKNELEKKNENFNEKNKNKKIKLKKSKKADKQTEKNTKKFLKNNNNNNIHLSNVPKNKTNQENSSTKDEENSSTKDEEDVDNFFLQADQTNQQINFETMSINNFFNFCIQYTNLFINQMKLNYQPKKEIFSNLQKVNTIFIKSFSEKIKHIEDLNMRLTIEKKTYSENLKKLEKHYQKRLKEFQTKKQNSKTNQILQNQILVFKQIIEKLLKSGLDLQQMVADLD
ncbi:hypothetical protein M0813_18555 [Anaeramoeba flamelloides]|uniref:Uncharacterized protein n=1 Tax=Anaeramoeba flamelloides TaxID=1746091 RepID=A0ABQ8YSC2_9EUKA|nr:hypothetical protein M0813_18555 [Anaeramoeba flamelloides]